MENTISEKVEKILKKVREIRKTKGLSHENMAHELDMSSSAYNKLERGETVLSVERLFKLKQILDLDFTDLLDLKVGDIFHQDFKGNASVGRQELKDNAIAHVENLYQENKEINEKFMKALQDEISFLRSQISK